MNPASGIKGQIRITLFTALLFIFPLPETIYAEDAVNPEATSTQEEYPADETATEVELKPVDEADPWKDFIPPIDKYDWLQLTSGEWLKGDLKVMYGKEMEFDSDELGILKIDLEDIRQFRSASIKSVRVNGPLTFFGMLELTPDQIIITQGETQRVFDRTDLVSITPGASNELQKWSAKISLGLDVSGGNTEQGNLSAKADIRRRTAANRFVLTYLGQYSETRGTTTADNSRLNAFVDVFRTRNFFLRPVVGEYYRDPFQNIQRQYTIGTGIGYQIIDTAKTEWNVTTGIAYQETQFDSVEAGQDDKTSTPAWFSGTAYETELTKRIDFKGNYSFRILNKESGRYTHHATAAFETELTSWLDFDITLVWDRIQEPTANADGTVPKQDDYKMIFTLGVEY